MYGRKMIFLCPHTIVFAGHDEILIPAKSEIICMISWENVSIINLKDKLVVRTVFFRFDPGRCTYNIIDVDQSKAGKHSFK